MTALLDRELPRFGLPAAPTEPGQIEEADVAPLPPPARRYLRFCGAIGRERVTAFRARFSGQFRRSPEARFQDVETDQFNQSEPIARLFYMKLRMFGLPIQGRDTYVAGKGRLLIRPLDLFTVEDWQGEETDASELVTWLNDAVLLAPSMLIHPRTEWAAIDESRFQVSVSDAGHRVSATVIVDPDGAVQNFVTEDRWMAGKTLIRATWSTPIGGWRSENGRRFPTAGEATWSLPDGPFAYARIDMPAGSIALNPPLD